MKTKKTVLLWLVRWAEQQTLLKVVKQDFIEEAGFELYAKE